MQIALSKVIPVPLREKVLQRPSDLWNSEVVFEEGQWVKIKAPSGTGKTTLVHILYKLRHDYEGQVRWNNKSLEAYTAAELAVMRQSAVSIIFQDMRLFANLTARENIELNRILPAAPAYEATDIDRMAEQLQVSHILNQRAGVCSYGEQQRIAIIRALMQPFSWLIMDEPFSHLDENNTRRAAALIAEECTRRKAGFILTDLDEDDHFAYTKYAGL
jgi:putative ABC transport system ATP-binding protein